MNKKRIVAFILAILMLLVALASVITVIVDASGSVVIGVNRINSSFDEGLSMIVTRKTKTVLGTGASDFCWWRTATFEWNDSEGCYIVRSVNLTADGSNGKNNFVPQNGFVLVCNLGNDYGNIDYTNKIANDAFYALEGISQGDKAYLVGIDLENSTIECSGGTYYLDSFTSDAKIYIGSKPSGCKVYEPDTSAERLSGVEFDLKSSYTESEELKFSWGSVDGAEYYLVNVNISTVFPDGKSIVTNKKVTATEFTVDKSKLKIGNKYTVSINACAEGKRDSYTISKQTIILSDKCADSPFIGKKIMAFGDSITAFTGWVSLLTGELGCEVINAGVGGNTTTDAIKRLKKDIVNEKPDIVFVLFGMNDQAITVSTGNPLVSLTAYERNYRKIITSIHDCGAEVVLLTGNNVCVGSGFYQKGQYGLDYGTGNLNNYYDVIRKLAEEYNLNLIDINKKIQEEGIADSVICMSGDGIHLSEKGQNKFTSWISDYMYSEYFENGFPQEESEESVSEVSSSVEVESEEESTPKEESGIAAESTDISASASESDKTDNEASDVKIPVIVISVSAVSVILIVYRRITSKGKNKEKQ